MSGLWRSSKTDPSLIRSPIDKSVLSGSPISLPQFRMSMGKPPAWQAAEIAEETAAMVGMGVDCLVGGRHWFGIGRAPFDSTLYE
jgi:hypothetical protein